MAQVHVAGTNGDAVDFHCTLHHGAHLLCAASSTRHTPGVQRAEAATSAKPTAADRRQYTRPSHLHVARVDVHVALLGQLHALHGRCKQRARQRGTVRAGGWAAVGGGTGTAAVPAATPQGVSSTHYQAPQPEAADTAAAGQDSAVEQRHSLEKTLASRLYSSSRCTTSCGGWRLD